MNSGRISELEGPKSNRNPSSRNCTGRYTHEFFRIIDVPFLSKKSLIKKKSKSDRVFHDLISIYKITFNSLAFLQPESNEKEGNINFIQTTHKAGEELLLIVLEENVLTGSRNIII